MCRSYIRSQHIHQRTRSTRGLSFVVANAPSVTNMSRTTTRSVEAAPVMSAAEALREERVRSKPRGRVFVERRAEELAAREAVEGPPRGRGSAASGWKVRAPQPGAERERVFAACGQRCFLSPVTGGPRGGLHLAFPVCRRPAPDGSVDCRPDPGGVQAAYGRARQWHHAGEARRALVLRKRLVPARASVSRSSRALREIPPAPGPLIATPRTRSPGSVDPWSDAARGAGRAESDDVALALSGAQRVLRRACAALRSGGGDPGLVRAVAESAARVEEAAYRLMRAED